MDPITRNLKRMVSSAPATSILYYTGVSVKDNVSNTAIFTTTKQERLTVAPFTITNTTKLSETSDFITHTETPNIFPISNWGAGHNIHSQYSLWFKSKTTNVFNNYNYAVNDNNTIMVIYDFNSTKIKVSTDGGTTWVDSTTTFPGYFGGKLFYSEQKFWMIYYNGQGAWTSTDGMTWTTGGTSNYESNSWNGLYGTPNYTIAYNATWNGTNYTISLYTIRNNVVTTGPSLNTSSYGIAVANKTSGYNNIPFNLVIAGERVYTFTWNGTAAVVTTYNPTQLVGRFASAVAYDENSNRWLALTLNPNNWSVGNEIYESFNEGFSWSLVTTVPDQYSNKATIFQDTLGRIVISGNAIGTAVYDEVADKWLPGDSQERVISIKRLADNKYIMLNVNWRDDQFNNRVAIATTPTIAEGPIFTTRKWHGYTNTTTSITQHFSSDGYNTFSNTTPTFLNGGYDPYTPNGNTGPSYITRAGVSATSRSTAGANYDNIHYLITTDNTDGSSYQSRPFATVNVWKSTDSGNNYNMTSNFAYNPTYYDGNLVNFSNAAGLPAWTDAEAPTNSEICYSLLIANPTYSTASNLFNRVASVTPASINDMIYQDGAFWAWGHNGLLMTSPNEGTDYFNPSWKKFQNLQDLCLGSRITAFCKEGSKLFVFTNLGQCIVSLDLGVTWTDRTVALRNAGVNPSTATYLLPMNSTPLGCIYINGKLIMIVTGGIIESTDDGVTWTKNAYNASTNGFPSSIAKHPTSDVVLIGTQSGGLKVFTSALTTFTNIFLSASSIPVSKIIWAGTRWYVFFDNNTTALGRYCYNNSVTPNVQTAWVTPASVSGSTALPTVEIIGGTVSPAATTNAYWDGTRLLVTDYINNQVWVSEGTTNSWQNISNGIRIYSSSVFKNKLKHVWTVASNGTMLVAAGDMCECVASTPANALAATQWSVTTLKRQSGVEDPVIKYDTEYYVSGITVTNSGSGYSPAGAGAMLYNLTLNCSNPSKPNGGVKPLFANAGTGTTGNITFVSLSNSGFTHGYTGTENLTCTLSGGTGTGFQGTLVLRKKPTNVRFKSLGRGFGPMSVTSATYTNDGATAEIYFMGNPSTITPSLSNICPMKIILADRVSTNLPAVAGSGFPFVTMSGNNEDGFLYAKTRSSIYAMGLNRNTANRYSNARTTSRATYDKGVTWYGNFLHKTMKPLFMDSSNMNLMNNKSFPLMDMLNEHRSRASIGVSYEGGNYANFNNKLLYSGWYLESDGTSIELYPFLIAGVYQNASLMVDDTFNNLLSPIKNDIVVTLNATEVQQFANTSATSQLSFYPSFIQVSDNAVTETSLANTVIVAVTKPKTQVGTAGGIPTNSLDDMFWYRANTNGSTALTWTNISAPIRAAVNNLVVPAGANLTNYAPTTFRWSKDDNLWYASSAGISYWTSPDLNTWTVVQDPAGLFPSYPN